MPVYFYDPPEGSWFARWASRERIFYPQATERASPASSWKFQVARWPNARQPSTRCSGAPAERRRCPPPLLRRCRTTPPRPSCSRIPRGRHRPGPGWRWRNAGHRAQEESDEPVEPLAEDPPADGPGCCGLITPGAARAFAQRAAKIVSAVTAMPAVRAAGYRAHLPPERSPRQPCRAEAVAPDDEDGEAGHSRPARERTLEIEGGWWTRPTRRCTARSWGYQRPDARPREWAPGARPPRGMPIWPASISRSRASPWDFPIKAAGRARSRLVASRAAGWDVVRRRSA
jgi:hypothetical protein